MEVEKIKNWDKLSDEHKEFVRVWSQITDVYINDDGLYILAPVPCPATPNAYMFKEI